MDMNMNTMDNMAESDIFNGIADETPVNDKKAAEKAQRKAEDDAFVRDIKSAFNDKIKSDPNFGPNFHRLSDSLIVVNSLGDVRGGNLVEDKDAPVEIDPETGKPKRKLAPASANIGYAVKNIGTEPIPYQTEVWTPGEDGIYRAQLVDKTLAPEETIFLTRKFLAILAVRTEFSCQLANGQVILKRNKNNDLEQILSKAHFRFNKAADGSTLSVNADGVKILVNEVGADGVARVRTDIPGLVEAFGYLNNPEDPKPKREKKAKGDGNSPTVQDYFANYIYSRLNGEV